MKTLNKLTHYMGNRKKLFPVAIILSAASELAGIAPYILIWLIMRELLAGSPVVLVSRPDAQSQPWAVGPLSGLAAVDRSRPICLVDVFGWSFVLENYGGASSQPQSDRAMPRRLTALVCPTMPHIAAFSAFGMWRKCFSRTIVVQPAYDACKPVCCWSEAYPAHLQGS